MLYKENTTSAKHMTSEQQKFEQFFYNEIILLDFDASQIKIKEFGKGFDLKKIDNDGNINIINNDLLYATFTSKGITFK